jgi:protein tyrosine phosphatase
LKKETSDNNSDYINASIVRSISPVWSNEKKTCLKILIYLLESNKYNNIFEILLCISRLTKDLCKKQDFLCLFSGPTEATLDDFVRMIVEQEITLIVMLSFTYDPITCIYAVR